MTTQAVTPRGNTRVELDALADSCRAASGELLATAANLERCCHRATTVAAIGLLALCAAVVLVAVRFYAWGMLSQAIATADSIALMAGGLWLDRIDRRSRAEIAAVRRAAERARGGAGLLASGHAKTRHETPENVLSQAIASVDSIALNAGGIWLEKVDKRSNAEIAAPRRAAEPPRPALPAGGTGATAVNRPRVAPTALPAPAPSQTPASQVPPVPPASSHRFSVGDPHQGTPVR